MVCVRPFMGLRPSPGLAEKVAAPPYDVLDSNEAREMASGNPHSFLHINKPEIDLPESMDPYNDAVYAKGAENLARFISEGTMKQDAVPQFYFYRQIMNNHAQVGLVATVSADDYEAGKIKKHEFTRPDKENDRIRHIMALNAQVGPVFLTYPDEDEINCIQAKVCAGKPECDFVSADNVRHTLWLVDKDNGHTISKTFEKVPYLYVADGHHRSAAGTIVARQRRDHNPGHTGNEEYNFFLAVIFPKSHMKIMAYNRAVMDLNGLGENEFLQLVGDNFIVKSDAGPSPGSVHTFSMYLGGKWYCLEPKQGSYPVDDPVKSIDASILQQNLLHPILGIDNPRTDNRIKFIGGIRGTGELEKLVNSGKFKVAFSLYPVTLDQLFAVADSGNVMPPKSTWFEPKLRSGLVVHML
ncbi:MAG: DUF1015 family protein [Candidatus Thermoplasmatota archaeon]|nr:DUF1015 domain-containing protein [Euryarchaeota archaeon]MBU4033080.1 DUF1015 family protein [Candidatus Thermoplasmatota archaeon]MBU4070705.1 DUF1015 family protein [Candidatus Thermoplasmatota archaeon]MBU4143366.1 DUF1015 family protein [Candidatus Thermoplasmatota archaeon]MBU4591192.1 DUF1015 family protein [Candidatus Thermoplasmatota archaeon]